MRLANFVGPSGPGFALNLGEQWVRLGRDDAQPADLAAAISLLSSSDDVPTGEVLPEPAADGYGCPLVRPGKIVAAGANYLAHAQEAGLERPPRPLLFAKYPSSLNTPTGEIRWDSSLTSQLDYEGELAVVIGRSCHRVSENEALDFVFGYAVANDVSARDLQKADGQLSRSKSMDTFCPVGPWIATVDEVPDPHDLRVTTRVNGEVRQDASTSDMLFSVRELISYLSLSMTLEPGDVILTGTPEGTALGFDPPKFLGAGDVVRCEIAGLGYVENRVVDVPSPVSAGPAFMRRS